MNGLPILNYHALDDRGSVISTAPSWFEQMLRTLHAEGFRCVDLESWVIAGRPVIERGFALTFDDGLSSIQRGVDVLVRYGFTATVFVVTGRIGLDNRWPGQPRGIPTSKLLDKNDLIELRSVGLTLGAHSVTHPHVKQLTLAEMEQEIVDSRAAVEQLTGAPCRLFAYPYGDAPAAARKVIALEFAGGFGTRLAYANTQEDRDDISRIDSYYLRTTRSLRSLVDGSLPRDLRLRRAARAARRAFAIA